MKELKRRKIYFASHVKTIEGTPDIVFRRKKIAVFIDSDFWHGHPTRFIMPKTNRTYWESKIKRNRRRDRQVTYRLKTQGWRVIRIWEYNVTNRFDYSFNRIIEAISSA